MPGAVLFDLDETLYPYRDYKLSGFRAVAAHVGRRYGLDEQAFFEALTNSITEHGLSYRHSFDDAIEAVDAPEVPVGELLRVYRRHEPSIELPGQSQSVIEDVRKSTQFVGIVTEGHRVMQQKKVDALGLEALVDEITITEDKTRLDAFERVLSRCDLPPTDVAYVGDDPSKDFEVPSDLGMVTVRVRVGMHADVVGPGPEPTHEVSSLADVPEVLC